MKLAYICSPYRGDIERNIEYAKELTLLAIKQGYAPITPHLYLTQVLDDNNEEQRKAGMEIALELLKKCDVVVVGTRYGVSQGMARELDFALRQATGKWKTIYLTLSAK
jgi:nucleoside 2-deoxyribosyltransferase